MAAALLASAPVAGAAPGRQSRVELSAGETLAAAPVRPADAPTNPATWSDEFDGTSLDLTRWSYRATGPRGDGNITPDAVSVGDGALTIKTYTDGGKHYSGMISTQRHDSVGFEQAYGYFEARVKFNDSPGQWSAFWLQSPTIGSPLGDPATAGVETDIVEHRARCTSAPFPAPPATCAANNDISNRSQRALIWDGYGSARKASVQLSDPLTGLGNGSWHTWALRWTPTEVTFYYDEAEIWSTTGPISQRSQYIILSSEVDHLFAGAIPAAGYGSLETSTTDVQVDYVRVWALAQRPTAVKAAAPTPALIRTAAADRTAPNARISGRMSQSVGMPVVFRISCPDEACRATATGTVRVPRVGRAQGRTYMPMTGARTIAKGTKVTVRLKLSSKARGAIRRALGARRRIVLRLGVRVADSAGNTRPRTLHVVLKR